MKAIRESAEHHFLTTLERLKGGGQGWAVFHFGLSKFLDHKSLISKPSQIDAKIDDAHKKSEAFLEELVQGVAELDEGFVYLFTDNDVLMLVKPKSEKDHELVQKLYWEKAKPLPAGFAEMGMLANSFNAYLKLADHKFFTTKRFEAYHAMSDVNKVSSIFVRRERREDPKVMIVEDDRFTAAYTAGILGSEYEVIVARSGEEGIVSYIEHAPDIVFLDIHLPGLSGHETLQAIRAVDSKAYVVMLSVDTATDSIKQALALGAATFLKKPYSKQRIINVVKTSPYVRGAFVAPPVPAKDDDANAR